MKNCITALIQASTIAQIRIIFIKVFFLSVLNFNRSIVSKWRTDSGTPYENVFSIMLKPELWFSCHFKTNRTIRVSLSDFKDQKLSWKDMSSHHQYFDDRRVLAYNLSFIGSNSQHLRSHVSFFWWNFGCVNIFLLAARELIGKLCLVDFNVEILIDEIRGWRYFNIFLYAYTVTYNVGFFN